MLRGNRSYKFQWMVPGGMVDFKVKKGKKADTSYEEAVVRECLEETGLRTFPRVHGERIFVSQRTSVYLILAHVSRSDRFNLIKKNLQPGEITDWAWVNLSTLKTSNHHTTVPNKKNNGRETVRSYVAKGLADLLKYKNNWGFPKAGCLAPYYNATRDRTGAVKLAAQGGSSGGQPSHPKLCKFNCGNLVGKPSNGRTYDTCCKTCAVSSHHHKHDKTCRAPCANPNCYRPANLPHFPTCCYACTKTRGASHHHACKSC